MEVLAGQFGIPSLTLMRETSKRCDLSDAKTMCRGRSSIAGQGSRIPLSARYISKFAKSSDRWLKVEFRSAGRSTRNYSVLRLCGDRQ